MSSFFQSLGNALLGDGAFGDTLQIGKRYVPAGLLDVFSEDQQRQIGQQIQGVRRDVFARQPSFDSIQANLIASAKAIADQRKAQGAQQYLQQLQNISDPTMTPASLAFKPEVQMQRNAERSAAATGGTNDARSQQAQMYRSKALIASRAGQTEDAKRFSEIAESLDPLEKISPTFQTVVDPATQQRVLARTGDRGTTKLERGYNPAPDFMEINQGGQTRVVDRNTLPLTGMTFPKTLAPQVIGSPERGYYQVGGGSAPAGGSPGGAMPGEGSVPGVGAYGTLPGQAGMPAGQAGMPQAGMPPQGAAPSPQLLLAGRPTPEKPDDLRKEINALPQIKNWSLVRPAWESAERAATNNTRAGDLDIIYAVAKTVDPDSVVRESEAKMVADATSPANQFMGLWSMVAGGGRLTPAQRSELMGLVRNRAQSHWDNFENTKKTYATIASGRGFDPLQIFIDHGPRPANTPGLGSAAAAVGAAAGAVGGAPEAQSGAVNLDNYGLEPRPARSGRGTRRSN
jgi:hypothetical protein